MSPLRQCAEALGKAARVRPGAVRDALAFAFAFSILFTPFYLIAYIKNFPALLALMKALALFSVGALFVATSTPQKWRKIVQRGERNYLADLLLLASIAVTMLLGPEALETFSVAVAGVFVALSLHAFVRGDEESRQAACLFFTVAASGVVAPSWAVPAWVLYTFFAGGLDAIRRGEL